MLPERVSVKFFVDGSNAVDLPTLVPVFHRWIQEHTVPGLLIDVADYKHVMAGPGVLLLGHEGDYMLDEANGRPGLLYKHKREWESDNFQERLRLVLQRAAQAAQLLQADPTLEGLTFRTDEVEIIFPDRLNVRNTPETFTALQADVTAVLQELNENSAVSLAHVNTEARRPFTIHAVLTQSPQVWEV
jgi:hypothetical protein